MQHTLTPFSLISKNKPSQNIEQSDLFEITIHEEATVGKIYPENERRGGFIFNTEISAFFILLIWCLSVTALFYLFHNDTMFVTFNHQVHERKSCTIAVVSSFPPKQCGVGAFAWRLTQALERLGCEVDVFALRDDNDINYNTSKVKYILNAKSNADFITAGRFMDNGFYDFVILQHEFSLFPLVGAESELVRTIKRVPVYSVVHNSHSLPTKLQLTQIRALADASTKIVVMSKRSRNSYAIGYGIPREKLRFIPHGVVDLNWDFLNSVNIKEIRRELEIPVDKKVILTFGLLHRKKGVQYLLSAMPYILKQHPDAMLVVLGQVNRDETQRNLYATLLEQAISLNIQDKVRFNMKYIPDDALLSYLLACDVYVTPYLEYTPVSGTLSYAMATGRAVVTTKYMYAQELLDHNKRGRLARMANPIDIAKSVTELLHKPQLRRELGLKAYKFTRRMVWDRVAFDYLCQVSQEPQAQGIRTIVKQHKQFSCKNATPKCFDWNDHKSFKEASLTFAFFRGFDDRKVIFDLPLSPYFGSHVYSLLTDSFLQLNGKFETHELGDTAVSIVTALGLRWGSNYIYIDAEKETLPDFSNIQPMNGIEVTAGVKYENVKYVKFIKQHHYLFEFLIHNSEKTSWIDIHMIALNNLLTPHGLMGQSAKFIHHVDKKKCEGRLSIPKDDCPLYDGFLSRYEVRDGIFGVDFHYNQFMENNTINSIFFCDVKPEVINIQLDESSKDATAVKYFENVKSIISSIPNVAITESARVVRIDSCISEIDAMAYTDYHEVFAPSHISKNCIVKSGVAEDAIFVMPYAVNVNKFRAVDADNFLSNFKASFKFLFRGSFNEKHGLDLVLSQYQKAFSFSDDVVLVIDRVVSSSEDPAFVKKMLATIESILTTSNAPKLIYIEEQKLDLPLEQLYSSVDVLVYPYRFDTYGSVLVEAMSSALPVITSVNGSAADICDPFNSYLVSSTICTSSLVCEPNPDALLQQMHIAYKFRQQNKLRGQLAMAAIQLLRSEDVLREVLELKITVGSNT